MVKTNASERSWKNVKAPSEKAMKNLGFHGDFLRFGGLMMVLWSSFPASFPASSPGFDSSPSVPDISTEVGENIR